MTLKKGNIEGSLSRETKSPYSADVFSYLSCQKWGERGFLFSNIIFFSKALTYQLSNPSLFVFDFVQILSTALSPDVSTRSDARPFHHPLAGASRSLSVYIQIELKWMEFSTRLELRLSPFGAVQLPFWNRFLCFLRPQMVCAPFHRNKFSPLASRQTRECRFKLKGR